LDPGMVKLVGLKVVWPSVRLGDGGRERLSELGRDGDR
jgi:hypothetical protein